MPGVQGLGFKSVAKRFPMLGNEETVILQDGLDFAASHRGDSVHYKRVSESADLVRRNWQLVHLDGSMLSAEQMKKVEHAVETFVPSISKMPFIKILVREGVSDFDTEGFFYDLSCIEGLRYSSEKTC